MSSMVEWFNVFQVHLVYILVIVFMWQCCDVVTCETVEALNSIFQKWDLQAVALWNTTGDPCSGSAIEDGIDFEDPRNNPAIKCDCTYENSTTCHITRMYASLSLSLSLSLSYQDMKKEKYHYNYQLPFRNYSQQRILNIFQAHVSIGLAQSQLLYILYLGLAIPR